MEKNNIKPQQIFFLFLFLTILILVAKMFSPFLFILMWASLLYLLISPLYKRVMHALPKTKWSWVENAKRGIFSALFSIATLFIVFIPLSLLVIELNKQLIVLFNMVTSFIEKNPQFGSFDGIEDWIDSFDLPVDITKFDIRNNILSFLSSTRSKIFSIATVIASGISHFVIGFVFMMFSLFFFLSEGEDLINILVRSIPIDHKYSRIFIQSFKEASRGILFGFFLTSIIQGIIAFIIFNIFNIDAAFALSVLVSVTSFIPMVGASLVWIPLTIITITQSGVATGILFGILCGVFISFSDNFLRPFLLRGKIKLHPLLIFFSILGGLTMFGINGLILGPLILTLFFTSLEIFLHDNP